VIIKIFIVMIMKIIIITKPCAASVYAKEKAAYSLDNKSAPNKLGNKSKKSGSLDSGKHAEVSKKQGTSKRSAEENEVVE
jgi:hypothetical protein